MNDQTPTCPDPQCGAARRAEDVYCARCGRELPRLRLRSGARSIAPSLCFGVLLLPGCSMVIWPAVAPGWSFVILSLLSVFISLVLTRILGAGLFGDTRD